MTLEELIHLPIHFTLVVVRLAGLMVFAPLIGSGQIPKRIKVYFAVVLGLAMVHSMPAPVAIPDSPWPLAVGLGGELAFGLAQGMILSLIFVAAQFAGAVAGQQMGFNLAGSVNPNADFGGDPLSDVYFILTLLLFLAIGGAERMLLGIRSSFDVLPPLAVTMTPSLLDSVTGMLMSATTLPARLAAPIAVSMLVVDLALGMVGKTIPQMNLMSVGLSLRALAGMVIIILGLGIAAGVLMDAIDETVALAESNWATPIAAAEGVERG